MPSSYLRRKFHLLEERGFRNLFIGSCLSRIGDGPVPVAFAIEAFRLTNAAYGISFVLLSLWFTRLVCVPIAGRIADRYNNAIVMVAGDVVRIIAQGFLAVAILSAVKLDIWYLCLSAGLYGIGTAFYVPAQVGLLPAIVPRPSLEEANGLLSVVADVSFLLGPVMAGILVTYLGFSAVLWLDCASFITNLCFILPLSRFYAASRHEACSPSSLGTKPASFTSGVRQLKSFRWFSGGLALWWWISISIGLVSVVGPAIALRTFGGAAAWSILATFLAIGSLAGSLSIGVFNVKLNWNKASLVVTIGTIAELVSLAWDGFPSPWALGPIFAIFGFTVSFSAIIWDSSYQRDIPDHILARFASIEGFVTSAGTPVGMALAGFFAMHREGLLVALSIAILLSSILSYTTFTVQRAEIGCD
jgi:MFS family permease